jgi:hypothetical protein
LLNLSFFHPLFQVGNFLIIASVLTTPKLRTVTNTFILSLGAADFLVGICVIPPAIMMHVSKGN